MNAAELIGCGLSQDQAEAFVAAIGELDQRMLPGEVWQWMTRNLLRPEHPMEVHEHLHRAAFADWDPADGPAPAWFPEDRDSSNIAWLMRKAGTDSYRDLHAWSVSQPQEFWATMLERLDVQFSKPFVSALDLTEGPEHPHWLVGAELNVVGSCFQAPDDSPAVIHQAEGEPARTMSVAELRSLAARVANGLANIGIEAGDRVAIDMPMTVESVAIYLGAVAAGCPVVTVADSFAPAEIAVRLKIGEARCIFTQARKDVGMQLAATRREYSDRDAIVRDPASERVPLDIAIAGCTLNGARQWIDAMMAAVSAIMASICPARTKKPLFIFADTNIFVEFNRIDYAGWRALFDERAATFVVTATVVREIDRLKGHRKLRVRKRARRKLWDTIRSFGRDPTPPGRIPEHGAARARPGRARPRARSATGPEAAPGTPPPEP